MRGLKTLVAFGTAAFTALVLSAAPASAQVSLDLLGDKDCFGSGLTCLEGSSLGSWGVVSQDGSDPVWQDELTNTDATQTWTHSFSPGVASAFLEFRTAGIADIRGPYDVFVDGLIVGQMPLDGFGHILVETFTFALPGSVLADGMIQVSFTPDLADSWAIDYSEVVSRSVVTPEPGTMALFAMGLVGMGFVARRREDGAGI